MDWRKSTFCNADSPMCVEVAEADGGIMIRDKTGYHLAFTPDEFGAFLAGVKAGEFDDLA